MSLFFYQFGFLKYVLKCFLAKPDGENLDLVHILFVIILNKFRIMSIRNMFFERNIKHR